MTIAGSLEETKLRLSHVLQLTDSLWRCEKRREGNDILGGGFKYVSFSPLLGEMIQFD